MRINNTNQTIFKDGDTSDIIKVVMMAYDIENDPQIELLARRLKAKTVYDTCRNIWQYLIDNVTYRADVGLQEIKSPARLIHDGSGDCKSYSLFTACILRYLGIDHVFRFVSYDNRKEATHVYVVETRNTERGTNNIIIDAVAYVQAGYPFNKELKYTYRCDMADKGTKIAYLAGLPKRFKKRIGETNTIPEPGNSDRYKVWIGDENAANITPGKHYLYALFDLNLEMANISKKASEIAYYLDQMDIVAALIYSYNYVNGNCKEFRKMAFIICGMIADGVFISSETNEDLRADKFNELLSLLTDRYNSGYYPERYDRPTWDMITHEVYAQNVIVGSSPGIGTSEYDVISKLKESGIYYIYTYLDQSKISNEPDIVQKKLDAQKKTYAWIDDINTYQSSSAMSLTIRSGIVARTGKTPEQYLVDLKAGKALPIQIGDPLTITLAVISIVTGLIKLIQLIWPPKTVPKPSDSVIKSGVFDPNTDYSKTGTSSLSTSSFGGIALPLALGGAVLWGLFKKK